MPDKVSAKSFSPEVVERFIKSDKVEANTHISKLINICYNDRRDVREYIIEISNLISKRKTLKLKLSKEILVHFILIFFLTQYNTFQDYL